MLGMLAWLYSLYNQIGVNYAIQIISPLQDIINYGYFQKHKRFIVKKKVYGRNNKQRN